MPKKGKYCYNATVGENTLFQQSRISAAACMLITYTFGVNLTFKQTIRESSIIEGKQVSRESVANRVNFCRAICIIALDQ